MKIEPSNLHFENYILLKNSSEIFCRQKQEARYKREIYTYPIALMSSRRTSLLLVSLALDSPFDSPSRTADLLLHFRLADLDCAEALLSLHLRFAGIFVCVPVWFVARVL